MTRPADDVRAAYDRVAPDYARLLPDMSLEAPLDRAVLAAFVETLDGDDPLVLDLGCGTGRVTAHLADAGVRVLGLDLSPGMLAVAAAARPDLPFAAGHAARLPVRSGSLGGLVAWYSLIHTPPDLLPGVLAELARVLRPGAPVLLAFQSGSGERVERTTSYGHQVPLTYHRHAVGDVLGELGAAGFALHATVQREAALAHETTPQTLVLAHRAGAA